MATETTIGGRIKQLRSTLNMTQIKFAQNLVMAQGYLAGVESGKRPANKRLLKMISLVYGVSEQWLKTGEGEMLFNRESEDSQWDIFRIFDDLTPENQKRLIEYAEYLLDKQLKEGRR